MEKNEDKAVKNDTSSASAVERGERAIAADERINKKDLDPAKVKKEGEKDAEQWRNEG